MKDKIRERCKETVCRDVWSRVSSCSRYAVKDGYCKQHHPDEVKKRRDLQQSRYEERRSKDPLVVAQKKIAELQKRIDVLTDFYNAQCGGVKKCGHKFYCVCAGDAVRALNDTKE